MFASPPPSLPPIIIDYERYRISLNSVSLPAAPHGAWLHAPKTREYVRSMGGVTLLNSFDARQSVSIQQLDILFPLANLTELQKADVNLLLSNVPGKSAEDILGKATLTFWGYPAVKPQGIRIPIKSGGDLGVLFERVKGSYYGTSFR